jgi:hypothetical protein
METAQSRPLKLNLTPENFISIGPGQTLYIQPQQWINGQKFLSISKSKVDASFYCSYSNFFLPKFQPKLSKYWLNILVPQDAYKFVTAMDEVIRQLPVLEPTHPGSQKLGLNLLESGLHIGLDQCF